jgi:hypothetical protein
MNENVLVRRLQRGLRPLTSRSFTVTVGDFKGSRVRTTTKYFYKKDEPDLCLIGPSINGIDRFGSAYFFF